MVTSTSSESDDVPIEVLVGYTLNDFEQKGIALDVAEIAPAFEFDRVKFIIDDLVDVNVSTFGGLFSDLAFWHASAKPIHAIKLSELLLLGSDGVVMREGRAVYDTLFDVSPWQKGSMVASFERGKSLRLRHDGCVSRRLPEGTYLIGYNGCWTNYAHWLQQMLPWLVAFTTLRQRVPGLRLIVPPFSEGSFHHQTLRLLGIKASDVSVIDHGEIVAVPSAYLVNRVDLWSVQPYCREAAAELGRSVTPDADAISKVYIHRRTESRQLANFQEIEPLLKEYGFKIVEFEDMPLEQQISLMKNAKYVIGEHGAGLINIMFCPEKARVLELFNPACIQPAFWSIASICRLDYGFLVGDHCPSESRPKPDWNSSYVISYGKLDAAIKSLFQQSA